MPRQPKQVHIFLFRKNNNHFEYAIFQRADMEFCWQGVCGGLENVETIEEGARREIFEETGIKERHPLYLLDSVSYLPDSIFLEETRKIWGKEIVVIPMYFYAMQFQGDIILSDEHKTVQWLRYDEAYDLVYYADQKTALYELNEKLLRNIILL